MDTNAKSITRARQIAKDYINRVGDWCDSKAISRAIEYMEEIYNLPGAPLRNCDRPECSTTKAAQEVWRKEDGGKTAYYEWLLAPATEKKGDRDGNE